MRRYANERLPLPLPNKNSLCLLYTCSDSVISIIQVNRFSNESLILIIFIHRKHGSSKSKTIDVTDKFS